MWNNLRALVWGAAGFAAMNVIREMHRSRKYTKQTAHGFEVAHCCAVDEWGDHLRTVICRRRWFSKYYYIACFKCPMMSGPYYAKTMALEASMRRSRITSLMEVPDERPTELCGWWTACCGHEHYWTRCVFEEGHDENHLCERPETHNSNVAWISFDGEDGIWWQHYTPPFQVQDDLKRHVTRKLNRMASEIEEELSEHA